MRAFEDDANHRALIIAAGTGDVSRVRTLLSQGVRTELETFNADANPRLRPGAAAVSA